MKAPDLPIRLAARSRAASVRNPKRALDYFKMLNARDGGINGVKFTWQKCETEYNNARGVECYERTKNNGPTGATLIHPLSTGITYSLIDKGTADKIPIVSIGYGRADAADGRVFPYVFPLITTYWSQAATMVRYIGEQEGGMPKLKGKKIALLYHDSAYGKEPIPVLSELAKKYGYPVGLGSDESDRAESRPARGLSAAAYRRGVVVRR
jgi:branched-chain amino acid transport system substrate-binding protein